LLEEFGPPVPAGGEQPQAVNEHDRRAPGGVRTIHLLRLVLGDRRMLFVLHGAPPAIDGSDPPRISHPRPHREIGQMRRYAPGGRMAERTKATVLKTVSGATRSRVRIPVLPPRTANSRDARRAQTSSLRSSRWRRCFQNSVSASSASSKRSSPKTAESSERRL